MKSLKIKRNKCCEDAKGKLNNIELVQIENLEIDIWKLDDFNFLNEEVEQFSNQWSPYLVNVRSPSYLKQKPLEYFLWGVDYMFSFSFWHGERFWINFSIVQLGSEDVRIPLPAAGPGQSHAGGSGNLIFSALNAIFWFIIYSFFTSNLMLPEEVLYKFKLLKWLQFVIF